jgi:hypothetical protein
MLRSLIYSAKHLLHKNPLIYKAAYNLATCNIDYLRQRLQASRYPSSFGGLWTDRDDYQERAAEKIASGKIDTITAARLDTWRTEGYIKVDAAIDHGLIDDYLAEVEALKSRNPSPLLVTSNSLEQATLYSPEVLDKSSSPRTVDDYFHSEAARQLLFDPEIVDFLTQVFEREPILTQSLNFERGS